MIIAFLLSMQNSLEALSLDSNTKFSIEISLGTTLNHYFFLKRIRILKFLAEELNKLYRNSANGMLTLQRLFFFLLAIVIHPRIRLSAFGDGAGTRCGSGFWYWILDHCRHRRRRWTGPRLKWKQMKLDVMRSCGEGEPVL